MKPADRPLIRTRLEEADLRAAWEHHAAEFVAWARTPDHDSYPQFHRELFLPMVPPPQPQPSAAPTETAQLTGPSLRVLVVDDNVDTVTTLAMLVQESGHEVRTAYDGLTVVEVALDYRPNVVLLDIGLPGLNGFEVAKRLRQQPALQNAVLVAMTGYGQESDRQRSREAGFDHHLVKPGDFGKVLQILATVSESTTG